MRIFIVVLLCVLVVLGVLYGARLMWRVWHPPVAGQVDTVMARWERWLAWGVALVLLVLFMIMIGDRLALDGRMPADWTAPSVLPSQQKAP
ncbi:MAG: hypothetical protein HQM04_02785 [Magnetococcales bacterium]|nr:hypothetical protein [Magnetococcales bacterium]MBF0113948.1 hypothetical protein [Magnetococcales bacterium]